VASSAGALHEFALSGDLARQVQGLAQRSGSTPFMVFLAAFEALLGGNPAGYLKSIVAPGVAG